MRIKNRINIPFGLDISDLSLKLAFITKQKNKILLKTLDKIEVPMGAIEQGIINDEKTVISVINKLLGKNKQSLGGTNEVVACLPETKTFIKLLEVDKSPNNLNDMVQIEMEKHVPMSIKDIYYDWQVVQTTASSQLILVGAAPKNIVNKYIHLLKGANLSISAMEVESTAICRSVLPEESPDYKEKYDKNYCIIDFGAKRSSLIIYSKNTIALSVSIPISGEEITRNIAKTLELKTSQAEKAKIVCGLDKSKAKGIVSDILANNINELIARVKEARDYFYAHYPKRGEINAIILCGGGANIKKLDSIINDALKIKAYQGNALGNIIGSFGKFPPNLNEAHTLKDKILEDKPMAINQNMSPAYATAIGLALRSLFL